MTYYQRELEMDTGVRNLPKRTSQSDGYGHRIPTGLDAIERKRIEIARGLEIERLRSMIDRSR